MIATSSSTSRQSRLLQLVPFLSKTRPLKRCVKELKSLLEDPKSSEIPREVATVLAEHPVAFRLLQELNKEEDGPRLLVKVRSKLRTDPGLWKEAGLLDSHLVRMLREAFGDRSTLELRQVIWAEASPELTKFIAQNDRVRPPTSENEVQDRLTATGNRRCFAFFSSRMLACEPVCFVHVALSQGTIDRISALPGTKHTVQDPDTATFYSINSPFTGLYGVRDFGNSLIKSTASLLKKQHPSILRFCTLSPVPGFRKWLEGRAAGTANMDVEALTLQCQEYLNPATTADPVARFHYRNGAHLRRVLADADKSNRAKNESFGFMASYEYTLS